MQFSICIIDSKALDSKATDIKATDSRATTPTPESSPLMRLPGELRNQIYRKYFDSCRTWDAKEKGISISKLQPCLNLLHSNHKVRSEAASIFYEEYVGDADGKTKVPETSPETYPCRWQISGKSRETRLQRLRAFCQSLSEHKVLDVKISLAFCGSDSCEAVSPRFMQAVTKHMMLQLVDSTGHSIMDQTWQLIRSDILGWHHVRSSLALTRTFQEKAFEMGYGYERTNDFEMFSLCGPLAKIDWSEFEFDFPPPMEMLELRAEATVYFARGERFGRNRKYHDSVETPSVPGSWTRVSSHPRRVQIWASMDPIFLCVNRGESAFHESAITTGAPRRHSISAGATPWPDGWH